MLQGSDDEWHQTDGLARLRFQLSIITAVRVVPVSEDDRDDFVQLAEWNLRREKDGACFAFDPHYFGPGGDCLPKDAGPPIKRSSHSISNLRFAGDPPFVNVRRIQLNRSTLAQVAYMINRLKELRHERKWTHKCWKYVLTPVYDILGTTKSCRVDVDGPSRNDQSQVVEMCRALIRDGGCKHLSASAPHDFLRHSDRLYNDRLHQLVELALTIVCPPIEDARQFFRGLLEVFTRHVQTSLDHFVRGLSGKVSIRIVKWSRSDKPSYRLDDDTFTALRKRMDDIIMAGCVANNPQLYGFYTHARPITVESLEREVRKRVQVDLGELRRASGEHTAVTSAVYENDSLLMYGGRFRRGSYV